jgi:hypothetical protein
VKNKTIIIKQQSVYFISSNSPSSSFNYKILKLTGMVREVNNRLKNKEYARKLFVNYFTGERIRVGTASKMD